MDKLFISKLRVSAAIGILPWELANRQDILIDLQVAADAKKAALSDNIQDALDYSSIYQSILNFIEKYRFNLVETLAHRLADFLQTQFKISWIQLTITKINILPNAEGCGVSIEREYSINSN